MGPGLALIVGVPFIVLTLSLLWVFRAERRRREAAVGATVRLMPLYRGLAGVLLAFIAFEVIGVVLAALSQALPPTPGS
jgi:hypothetical protein